VAIPELKGEALRAVRHRGSHIQIIACAGAGKTEVVAQRVADLFVDGVQPEELVAFTFTERAAKELKRRIEQRVQARLGQAFVDRLNGCFIGTIHAFCFRLLQEHVSIYETYDVLDEHRLAAFLTREEKQIGFKGLTGRLFSSIDEFTRNVDVVENELISLDQLDSEFRPVIERFHRQLERYRFLTYGQVIARAVRELGDPKVFVGVHNKLRYLIVDEYQDINPAQETLIRILAQAPVELCVVGDDDQSIYQWRGSDVGNIVTFKERYENVKPFEITTNRRSRPEIIQKANEFAASIAGRLPKAMEKHREGMGTEVVAWRALTEAEEAERIAETTLELHQAGYQYRDIAILVRSSTSYGRLLEAFNSRNTPVQPGGRTGLFMEPDAHVFGRTFAYLTDHEWRPERYGRGSAVGLDDLVEGYVNQFHLNNARRDRVRKRLMAWKQEVEVPTGSADLVGDYYDLLADCGVTEWDFNDPAVVARLGALARCSAILADYESIRRRSRPDEENLGEAVGGQDRGEWYFKWLAIHIQNWSLGAFEGFEGEEEFTLDAVDLTTIHQAKGLEWPIVFVPCVSAKRFPSTNTGKHQVWHVPSNKFDRERYEGTENDERRLFYVAMTRARDWLSISTHDTPKRQIVAPSPFLVEFAGGAPEYLPSLPIPASPEKREATEDLLSITFSELADFKSCGLAYRLRNLIGFQPSLVPELGYGKAVHHIMRNVAEFTRQHNRPPSPDQLELIFDEHFYLPAANKPAHREMKAQARHLVDQYVDKYGEDLKRVWAVERPFELYLPNAIVTGRVDVILDEKNGEISSLTIVDYKTAANEEQEFDRQLQVYTDAGRREGLDVKAAYIHDLKAGDRIPVDVAPDAVKEAEAEVVSLVNRLRSRDFRPNPGSVCRRCDVRAMCRHAVK
jgi:ATP-dependent DNA helicase UvrD/PcrA